MTKFLGQHLYTPEERLQQLQCLQGSLVDLLQHLRKTKWSQGSLAPYEAACRQAEVLTREGFTQDQLSTLARSIPDLLSRHTRSDAPFEVQADGTIKEDLRSKELRAHIDAVLAAAQLLTELGTLDYAPE